MLTNTQLNNIQIQGRMCNQLHAIASLAGIAQRNSTEFSIPIWKYAKYFKNFNGAVSQYSDSSPVAQWTSYKYEGMLYKNIDLDSYQNYDLQGYFQNIKYWEDSSAFIKHIFTPAVKVDTSISKGKTAIHVRHGDYLDRKGFHTCLTDTDYYSEALAEFPSNTEYLVFSDDINFCKDYFNHSRFTFVEPGSDYIDLFLMTTCDNFIIANSSFSWWGAVLHTLLYTNDTKIVSPHNDSWFANGMKTDVVPERWTKI